MEVQPRSTLAEYNQAARRETRRRWLLIVVLPMALLFLLFCGLSLFALFGLPDQGQGSRSAFAQMATVFLVLPMCLMSLGQFAVLAGLSFGVIKLSGKLPPVFFKVQGILARVQQGVERASNAAARPLIAGHARAAQAGRLVRALRAGPGGRTPGTP